MASTQKKGALPPESLRLRAVSHPTRVALLQHLASAGPSTATECANFVGASPSACSWHLRALAKAGWVETVPGPNGRERPWKYVAETENSLPRDPTNPIVTAVESSLLRHYRTMEDLFLRNRSSLATDIVDAAEFFHGLLWASPQELKTVHQQIQDILRPYWERDPNNRPGDALRIVASWTAVPWLPMEDSTTETERNND